MKRRGKLLIILGCVVIGVAIITVIVILTRSQLSIHSQPVGGNERPNFQTLAPHSSSDDRLENATVRTTPSDGQVFSYTDKIDDVPITVNQQKLPTNASVDEIAKNLNANHKVTGSGLTLYVGTSEQGPQTAVFSAKGLLILIKSERTVKDSSWIHYAASLN